MYDYFIKQYVEKINESDIQKFASQNGIVLTKEEIDVFLFYIKKDWRTIIYGNPTKIFAEVKDQLNPLTYQKMIELYTFFKEKYQNYL